MKNALIIGGSGGLSSVLAKMAMKDYSVWTLTRGRRTLPDGVKPVIADRNDPEAFENAVLSQNVRWDAVFDCICMNAENARQDIEVLSRVTDRLVVVSTDSVYDPEKKRIPQNEDGEFIVESGSTAEVSYGCNKRRMELALLEDMNSPKPRLKTTVFRPGHIYGPGFLLGCFPENSRQKELPDLIREGKPVRLVGMGTYIIQPVYVDDLSRVMLECVDNEKCFNCIFCIGGPDAVENRTYYEYIAGALGTELKVEEVPLKGYAKAHPEFAGHLCHRIYDLGRLRATGIALPATRLEDGIRRHLDSLTQDPAR